MLHNMRSSLCSCHPIVYYPLSNSSAAHLRDLQLLSIFAWYAGLRCRDDVNDEGPQRWEFSVLANLVDWKAMTMNNVNE
jgi:hypothetical protein